MKKTIVCPVCDGYGFNVAISEYSIGSYVCNNCNGSGEIEVPMTNSDRIRAMSDEELAAWMAECNAYGECADASQWLPWLRQPAKECEE